MSFTNNTFTTTGGSEMTSTATVTTSDGAFNSSPSRNRTSMFNKKANRATSPTQPSASTSKRSFGNTLTIQDDVNDTNDDNDEDIYGSISTYYITN
jgi:hypothetical protein